MGVPRIGEDYTELRTELARLLPEGVGYAVLDPRLPRPGMLYPVEAAAMTRAVPKRVNEFTAGRVAARQAMAMIGLKPSAIPMGKDRAPIWPEGVVGSISHCESACVAVAAPVEIVSAIGVDVEEDTPLDRDLWEEVCGPEDLAWLMTQPEAMRGRLAKRVFSVKEAVYKAIWPQERRVLGFGDVRVTLDPDGATLHVLACPAPPDLAARIAHPSPWLLASAVPGGPGASLHPLTRRAT